MIVPSRAMIDIDWLRVTRDLFTESFEKAYVDDDKAYKRIVGYLKKTSPHMVERVVRYREKAPLLEQFGVERAHVEAFYDHLRSMNFYDNNTETTGEMFERYFPRRTDVQRLLMEPIAYANGSNQSMGLDNVFYTATLAQTAAGYYVIGNCP